MWVNIKWKIYNIWTHILSILYYSRNSKTSNYRVFQRNTEIQGFQGNTNYPENSSDLVACEQQETYTDLIKYIPVWCSKIQTCCGASNHLPVTVCFVKDVFVLKCIKATVMKLFTKNNLSTATWAVNISILVYCWHVLYTHSAARCTGCTVRCTCHIRV